MLSSYQLKIYQSGSSLKVEIKVINSFSIKQDELDFAFAQHYFIHKTETAEEVCLQYACVFHVERTSLNIFLFSKV